MLAVEFRNKGMLKVAGSVLSPDAILVYCAIANNETSTCVSKYWNCHINIASYIVGGCNSYGDELSYDPRSQGEL